MLHQRGGNTTGTEMEVSSQIMRRSSSFHSVVEKDMDQESSDSRVAAAESDYDDVVIAPMEIKEPPVDLKRRASFSSLSVSRIDVQVHFTSFSQMMSCCFVTQRMRKEVCLYAFTEIRSRISTWAPYVLLNAFIIIGQFIFHTNLSSQSFHFNDLYYILYVFFFLCFAIGAIFMYFITFLSSPGFVQKNENQYSQPSIQEPSASLEFPRESRSVLEGDGRHLIGSRGREELKEPVDFPVAVRSSPVRVKQMKYKHFCRFCDMWRAPRSYHCRICKGCVARFDHHCPFFDNCIGGRNHRFFWWFLFLQLITILLCGTTIVQALAENSDNLDKRIGFFAYEMICITVVTMSGLVNLSLLVFHTYLALTDQTTFELLKKNSQMEVLHHVGFSTTFHALQRFCYGDLLEEWVSPGSPVIL